MYLLKCQKSFTKMSKYFTENFVHGDEAILSEKWPFSPLILPSSSPRPMKKHGTGGEILHTNPTFVHVFCSNFAPFRVFVSTPNFQKSTPNFQKALTFFLIEAVFFCQNQANGLTVNYLVAPRKIGVFSSKSCFRGEFLKYGGLKWPFCQFCSKKSHANRCHEMGFH